MTLTGFFDESERREQREPICVGGYLFKTAGYKQFRRYWKNHVLRLRGLKFKHFHTTDLCAGRGEYEELTIPDRVEILERAVEAIGDHAYAGIGIYFERAEFERMAPPEWPEFRGSIYSSACHMCLQATASWLRTWGSDLQVVYVFEQGHKLQAEANTVLMAIRNDARARKEFRYKKHLFEDKEQQVGLQAADLFAWTITKAAIAQGGRAPRAFRPFLPVIRRLASTNRDRQKVHVFTGDRLRRYLQEQSLASGEEGIAVDFGPRRRTFR